jgi:glucose uptake protein
VFALGLVLMPTLGSMGGTGMGALENLRQASGSAMLKAIASGAIFNASNILLVVAIDAAGMSVAFPVGVGLALVIGTVASYVQSPKGNPVLLFGGVALVVFAMIVSALAYRRLPGKKEADWGRGLLFAVIAGGLMGFFYPELAGTISPSFQSKPIETGLLTPYTALFLFGVGLLASNFLVNSLFMRAGKVTYADYFRGSLRLHSLGFAGGVIWMVALTANILASGVAGPAISYALGQGATLVAAVWGVAIWKEFEMAPKGTGLLIAGMFAGYSCGLVLIGMATL